MFSGDEKSSIGDNWKVEKLGQNTTNCLCTERLLNHIGRVLHNHCHYFGKGPRYSAETKWRNRILKVKIHVG